MEAAAAIRASHLAVTGVKLAALAEREAVCLVGAEELIIPGVHQRDEGLLGGVDQAAVDALQVTDVREPVDVVVVVDGLEPLHLAVTKYWVATKMKIWEGDHIRRKTKGGWDEN